MIVDPKPESTTVTVKFSARTIAALERVSAATGLNGTDVINRAVQEYDQAIATGKTPPSAR